MTEDNISISILDQILKYEDNALSSERKIYAGQVSQKGEEKKKELLDSPTISTDIENSEDSKGDTKKEEAKKEDSKNRDNGENNSNDNFEDDFNQWSIDYIFQQWWKHRYTELDYKFEEVKGFKGRIPTVNDNSSNSTEKTIIGPLYHLLKASSENWTVLSKLFERAQNNKKIEIYFTGAGLYELRLGVSIQNGLGVVEDLDFNFNVSRISGTNDVIATPRKGSDQKSDEKRTQESPRFFISWDLEMEERLSFQSIVDPNQIQGINDSEVINYLALLLESRNAKAAIMSRNMSHNIGSHVLSYLHNDMDKYSLFDLDYVSAQYEDKYEDKGDAFCELRDDSSIKTCRAYVYGVQHFLAYMQERQDYIALISTNLFMPPISINFKDEIYDFFNPDKKHIRHNADNGAVDNLLLRYILKSENISRPLLTEEKETNPPVRDVVIRFGNFTGNESNHEDLERMRQLNIAMPGGTIGRQAVYSILENVMRNAAKHDAKSLYDKNLELTIDYFDRETYGDVKDDKLKSTFEKYYVTNDPYGDYFYITLTINVCPSDGDMKRLREAISEPFVEQHRMIETNKGIKEMRISAAWIRSEEEIIYPRNFKKVEVPDEDTDDKSIKDKYSLSLNNRPPILFVRKNQNGHLQYIFCMLKNKELAYVINDESTQVPKFPESWGWKTYTESEYCKLNRNTFFATIVADGVVGFPKVASHSGYRVFKESSLKIGKKISECETEENKEAVILEILRISSCYNEGDKILICDNREIIAKDAQQFIENVPINSISQGQYVYCSHYNPKTQYSNNKYIEAITGHNSTDRLLRYYHVTDGKSMLDLRWFYTHLLVTKSVVLIFDERLYDSMIAAGNTEVGLGNIDKQIRFFNLVDTPEGMKVMGVVAVNKEVEGSENSRIISPCEIALITYDENSGKLKFGSNGTFEKGDFISIHQGLFDKMFDKWEVKGDKRKSLIRDLYTELCKRDERRIEIFSDESLDFCPGMTIHSGRSIPNLSSMPMNIPFLPFSAIERAVSDCKYTLIELLINAKTQNRKV